MRVGLLEEESWAFQHATEQTRHLSDLDLEHCILDGCSLECRSLSHNEVQYGN
jgi:hypothetical protein